MSFLVIELRYNQLVTLIIAVTIISGLAIISLSGSPPAENQTAIIQGKGPSTVQVDIDTLQAAGSISPYIYGLNTARWDESLFPYPAKDMLLTGDRDTINKVKEAGITLLKYPGGNDADSYIWNSAKNFAAQMDTDEYAVFLHTVDAKGFITVNFTAAPKLAADWVDYCNNKHSYQINLWEVGDEVWGKWARSHCSGKEYGQKFLKFSRSMRAKDPGIKMAANLCLAPGLKDWNIEALKVLKDRFDIITFTFYPQNPSEEDDDKLLASPALYRQWFNQLKEQVAEALGRRRAEKIKFCCVGYNSVAAWPGPQTLSIVNAIWTAEMLGTFAETQTDMACFWALHNAYPPRGGDFGLLSSDGSNLPSYSYYALKMLSKHYGGQLITAKLTGSPDRLRLFGCRREDGQLTIICINKSANQPIAVKVGLKNFVPAGPCYLWRLSEHEKEVALPSIAIKDNSFMYTAPPYSVTALTIREAGTEKAINLALRADITASGYNRTGPNFQASSAIDGNPYTRWASPAWVSKDGADKQWLMLDLKAPWLIEGMVLKWGQSYAVHYELLSSEDGQSWHSRLEEKTGEGGIDRVAFPPWRARYLKLLFHQGRPAIATYSLIEWEVFGTKPQ